ncbi:hypothetical protein KI387_030975, partial [Taxus chinensis]
PQDEAHYDISKVPKVGQNSRPGRKHLRRGCQCHFSIRVLMKLQDRALITYNKMDHRDHEGKIFHGQETDDFRGSRCSLAPHISGALKDWVESLLLLGLTPELVHKKHRHMVHEKLTLFNGQTERDDFLSKDDIRNIEGKMKEAEYKFELNDADSVRTFATKNPEKFMLYTILAFDNMHNGLPVAWVLMSRATVPDLTLWMRKLVVSAHCHMLEWKPNAFMVDDARAEIVAIREVFQCEVYLCSWHVRRAWLKNLIAKVKDVETRQAMFTSLGEIMHKSPTEEAAIHDANMFIEKYAAQESFITYWKDQWAHRIGMWARCLHTMPHVGQETNAAIEVYHSHLKHMFLNEIRVCTHRRVDWLVTKLVTVVFVYYWWTQMCKENGFYRNFKLEQLENKSWMKSLCISDGDVKFSEFDLDVAWVKSQSKEDKYYKVYNADHSFALCECMWAAQGHVCKHILKVADLRKRMGMELSSKRNVSFSSTNHASTHDEANNNFVDLINDNVGYDYANDNVGNTSVNQNVVGDVNNPNDPQIVKIRKLLDTTLLSLPVQRRSLNFLEKVVEDACNKFRAQSIFNNGVVSHPHAQPFERVKDNYGTSLKRTIDFVENMAIRRHAPPTNEHAEFPPRRKGRSKHVTFQEDLDRAAARGVEQQ